MDFARETAVAGILVAMTLCLQCAGVAVLIHRARAYIARAQNGITAWHASVLMVRFTTLTIVLQILQVLLWAGFYRYHGISSWESCFYFSASSYSTVGYGDVSLPQLWRGLAPIESIVGVLMCGMSVSTLLAIATRLVAAEEKVVPSAAGAGQ
jgi:hypothetical protein